MGSPAKFIHYFSDPLPADCTGIKALLGGKGASLKEMTLAGLHVPPGFTLSTVCCEQYFASGRKWPPGLEEELRLNLARLERETKRTFGTGPLPLLVSVRSGAAASMPGMMDTFLNCGANPGLEEDWGQEPWFWDLLIQFVKRFGEIAHGVPAAAYKDALAGTTGHARWDAAVAVYAKHVGQPFPPTPWDCLVECVSAVFGSWLSPRAVAYREKNDVRGLRGTAVTVQMMFPSEVSGVLFTHDPTAVQANQMVIEASYGLGESVVSGDVTPDRFLVCREKRTLRKSEIGRKAAGVAPFGPPCPMSVDAPSLTEKQVAELTELAFKVEKHFGHPVDMEWGLANGHFSLLQSRAIRGLDVALEVETARRDEIVRLKPAADGRRRVWVTHNLGETLRAPTPLTWDIVRQFMSGAGGFGRLYQQLGYRPSKRVCDEGFLDLICGRIYADPDRLADLFWEGMPLSYDLDGLVADKSLLDRAPAKFTAEKADGLFLARLPGNLWGMWRASRLMARARGRALERFRKEILPPYLEYVARERKADLTHLTDEQVLGILRERCTKVLDDFGPESLRPGFFGGLAFDAAEGLLVQIMGEDEGREQARTLTLALENDTTFEQEAMLHEVAAGKAELAVFLERYGHRCIGEMELFVPRFRENSSYLEQTLARLHASPGRDPHEVHRQNVARREATAKELPARLAKWGGASLRERVEADLADAQALLPYRETGKHYLMMGYELIRLALQELARRWDLGTDLYFMQLTELPRYPQEKEPLKEAMRNRRRRWQALQRLDVADVIDSDHLDGLGVAPALDPNATEFTGTALAPGVATGTARIVLDPASPGELGPDYVLVCGSTDPGWTPLLMNARGLVVERGGVLSHGAIVARDFGLPAVACPNATKLLKAGEQVRVDGNRGRVVAVGRTVAHG